MSHSKNGLIVKSNRLVEASYRLDLSEQRLILLAINQARDLGVSITADSFLTIRASNYAKIFGTDMPTAYKQLSGAVKTLYQRSVRLHDIHPESGKARVIAHRNFKRSVESLESPTQPWVGSRCLPGA